MSKRKVRDLAAVFFVGLFLMTWEPVFIWLLAGALILLQPEKADEELSVTGKTKKIMQQIREDALRFQVKVPHRQTNRSLLIQVYRRYNAAREAYPHLKSEYREVINEMWTSLAEDPRPEKWSQILTAVLAEWPNQAQSSDHTVKEKLKKVKELSQQWDEAKKEALGGINA